MTIKIGHCKSVLAKVQRRGSSAPELQHLAHPGDHLIMIQLNPDVKIMTHLWFLTRGSVLASPEAKFKNVKFR
jgi:hypothetical protein